MEWSGEEKEKGENNANTAKEFVHISDVHVPAYTAVE
jgi:hypothetical protein